MVHLKLTHTVNQLYYNLKKKRKGKNHQRNVSIALIIHCSHVGSLGWLCWYWAQVSLSLITQQARPAMLPGQCSQVREQMGNKMPPQTQLQKWHCHSSCTSLAKTIHEASVDTRGQDCLLWEEMLSQGEGCRYKDGLKNQACGWVLLLSSLTLLDRGPANSAL